MLGRSTRHGEPVNFDTPHPHGIDTEAKISVPTTIVEHLVGLQSVVEADCLDYLRRFPTQSVHTVVTSPPYNLGVKYGVYNDRLPDAVYFTRQTAIAREIARVLKPLGHLFLVTGGDSKHPWRAIEIAQAYGRALRLQNPPITWVKSLAINVDTLPAANAEQRAMRESLRDRMVGHFNPGKSSLYLANCSESIWHFTPQGISPIDRAAAGVGYTYPDQPARFGHHRSKHCRGNVWHVPRETVQSNSERFDHRASFPVALATLCLKLAAPRPHDVVLDPFNGIGSTLLAARAFGLRAIGIDVDPDYCRAACQRLAAAAAAAAKS
jgi:site-specific DNA-methyltransferase (adenine-specific)